MRNLLQRFIGSLRLLVVLAVLALALSPPAWADDDDNQVDDLLGLLVQGDLVLEAGEQPDDASPLWRLLTVGDIGMHDLDVSAVLDDARELRNEAVTIDGRHEDGKVVVTRLRKKRGGLRVNVDGVLKPAERDLPWHVDPFVGSLVLLDSWPERVDLDEWTDQRVRVDVVAVVGTVALADGSRLRRLQWALKKIEPLAELGRDDLEGVLVLTSVKPELPERGEKRDDTERWYIVTVTGEVVLLNTIAAAEPAAELRDKTVRVSGDKVDDDGFYVTAIKQIDDITRTIEGKLDRPGHGYDDGALGWHVTTRDHVIELTGPLPEFESLAGKRVRVEIRLAADYEFYEGRGSKLVAGWEPTSVTELK